ncbi:MAG: EAL domain-containing protein [Gammaproteobacteria bacterium]
MTWPADSLLGKVIVLLLAALGVCQAATLAAVLLVTRHDVRAGIERELAVAAGVFARLFERRYVTLAESVQVLAADFGFKRAAATGDAPTIVSALDNHGGRIGAGLGIFVDDGGTVRAATRSLPALYASQSWREMLAALSGHDIAARTLAADGGAWQLVGVPVHAPERIGWLVMGFAVDDALAREMRALTGREVAFVTNQGDTPRVLAASLPHAARETLAPALAAAEPGPGQAQSLRLAGDDLLQREHRLDGAQSALRALLMESLSEALAPYHALALELAALFLVTLILACLGAMFLARGITRPLARLARAATRIGEGDYGVRIDIESGDEVGHLARALDTMQAEIAERERRIVHQAQHDDLTGLPNRWLARDRLEHAVRRAQRERYGFTVVQIDLSRFKHINDTFGHHVGDVVLEELGRRLVARLRRADTVARLGGDDFFLILERTPLADAEDFVDSLRATLTPPIELDGMHVSLDFRVGIAAFPQHAEDAAALMRRAEIALYDAKSSHRRSITYAVGRDDDHRRQLAVVSDLQRAMASGELSLHYQPKVDLANGAPYHAEALVRWVHPDFGFMPPDEFIGVLEESGNIAQLTRWVFTTAVRQCCAWRARGLDVALSINLSATDLLSEDLPAYFVAELARACLPAAGVTLEITESAVMRDPDLALAVLGELRACGFRLSIDDFGTGYSSLAQLKRMPVSELKIDKSFVLDLRGDGDDDARIVRSTIELAHGLGLEVTAEGVETPAAWHLLAGFGCDRAQGYLISKPLPADAFEAWLVAIRDAAGSFMVEAA